MHDQLGTAGTTSALIGGSAILIHLMNWLNENSSGLGIIIGSFMAFLTASFYIASIYLRMKELNHKNHNLILDEIENKMSDKLNEETHKLFCETIKDIRK